MKPDRHLDLAVVDDCDIGIENGDDDRIDRLKKLLKRKSLTSQKQQDPLREQEEERLHLDILIQIPLPNLLSIALA